MNAVVLGIETSSFLVNGVELFFTLLYMIVAVILCRFLLRFCVKKEGRMKRFAQGHLDSVRYNFPIRFMMETFLPICMGSIMNLGSQKPTTGVEIAGKVISGIVLMVYSSLIPISIWVLYKNKGKTQSEEFLKKFGPLSEDLGTKNNG